MAYESIVLCMCSGNVLNGFEKFPQVLIIHLKRFDVGNKGIRKNQQHVDFPIKNLNVCDKEFIYNLKGITNHYGTLNT